MLQYTLNLSYLIAVGITLAYVYFDIKNNRNIPNTLVYSTTMIAIACFFVFGNFALGYLYILGILGLLITGILAAKIGFIGEGDIWLLASLWMLIPEVRVFGVWIPSIIPVIGISGLFAIFVLSIYFVYRFRKNKFNVTLKVILTFLAYIGLAFIIYKISIHAAILSLVIGIVSTILLGYEKEFREYAIRVLPAKELTEGDIVALERLDSSLVEKFNIPKVLESADIDRLKKANMCIPVYANLPPFTPFILIGLIITILLSIK